MLYNFFLKNQSIIRTWSFLSIKYYLVKGTSVFLAVGQARRSRGPCLTTKLVPPIGRRIQLFIDHLPRDRKTSNCLERSAAYCTVHGVAGDELSRRCRFPQIVTNLLACRVKSLSRRSKSGNALVVLIFVVIQNSSVCRAQGVTSPPLRHHHVGAFFARSYVQSDV